jgi:hypothetical protein
MEEEWRDIKEFEGLYKASNTGKIKSIKKIKKQYISNNGYWCVRLSKKGKTKLYLTHRLIIGSFIENYSNKRTVNHKDGNKLNNKLDNLEWATDREQMDHAFKNGLLDNNCGENSYLSKLKYKDIYNIIKMKKEKIKEKIIIEKYKISRVHIWRIVNNKRWRKKNASLAIN